MAYAKQPAKRKRRKTALPMLGAAGVSLTMAGGASAAVAPTANGPLHDPHRLPCSFSMRRKSPTSAWRRSTSSTGKTNRSASASSLRRGAAEVAEDAAAPQPDAAEEADAP